MLCNFVVECEEGRFCFCLFLESFLIRCNYEEEEEIEEENNENLEGKYGNKKLSRLSSRCKENGCEFKLMFIWE